ncbi:hypothetical protein [uncultured Mediterranean phage uvMED]|nr:hypothetical protein [uncultured Mediterranean phage uvMED]
MSNDEMAHYLAKKNEEAVIREKATYKQRSRQIRKDAEKINLPDGMKVRAVYDARTYFRHAQQEGREGCMTDEGYLRELRRDNDEISME